MAYKIKQLIDNGFDFNTLFPEKQEEARKSTLLNYSVQEIVDFLKSQTQDFTQDFPLAKDLDKAIYRLYEKKRELDKEEIEEKVEEGESKRQPRDKSKKGKAVEFTREQIIDAIDGLKLLAEMGDEDAKDALEGLELLLD
jgi:hypothetical protein